MFFGNVVQEIRSIDAMKVLATVIALVWRLTSRGRMRWSIMNLPLVEGTMRLILRLPRS
jgi:hypothetical protein